MILLCLLSEAFHPVAGVKGVIWIWFISLLKLVSMLVLVGLELGSICNRLLYFFFTLRFFTLVNECLAAYDFLTRILVLFPHVWLLL